MLMYAFLTVAPCTTFCMMLEALDNPCHAPTHIVCPCVAGQ